MAAKVALTAEEFRENSQRSIALFNTEKLSTDSTHVLKSAYCNSVHFCRCNLHGACGGKAPVNSHPQIVMDVAICTGRVEAKIVRIYHMGEPPSVAICTGRVEAKRLKHPLRCCHAVAICTGRVEAKEYCVLLEVLRPLLQSARGVWRQRYLLTRMVPSRVGCNLHGACGGKGVDCVSGIGSITLQSARGVWRQRTKPSRTKRKPSLQSARGVWRQSALLRRERNAATVAICTGRVEAKIAAPIIKASVPRCNLHGACGGKGSMPLFLRTNSRCNLHGACGGKECKLCEHF